MKKIFLSCIILFFALQDSNAQKVKQYTPAIERCDCQFKMDSSYIATAPLQLKSEFRFQNKIDSSYETLCGYLIIPENRKKVSSKTIKLPFILIKSKNPHKRKDPILYTGGGPGNSSLGWANGIAKSSLINDRDCIAFEQRGTRFALPYLRSFELDTAIKESYRKNLPKDSMVLEGVKRYKKKLMAKGIDLSCYNTDETVADIDDLLKVLHIDSVNLFGGSYSGGLMMAVLQKDPSRVRSLVLDSPLPTFVPIDEDEPVNLNEALNVLFRHCEEDSSNKALYGNLKEKFQQYFTSITNKLFYFPYLEKGSSDTISVQYTVNDLLDRIENSMLNFSMIKDVPFMITEMIKGNHSVYLKEKLDDIFNKNIAPDGMRISVYCADQSAYHNEEIIQQLYKLYPYMSGYHINDVYKAICDCWKVPPLLPTTKQAFYSEKPALIGDGEMDPACRPLYMSMIQHYLPNTQCFLFKDRSHGVGGKDFYTMTQNFLSDPFKKIEPNNKNVVVY